MVSEFRGCNSPVTPQKLPPLRTLHKRFSKPLRCWHIGTEVCIKELGAHSACERLAYFLGGSIILTVGGTNWLQGKRLWPSGDTATSTADGPVWWKPSGPLQTYRASQIGGASRYRYWRTPSKPVMNRRLPCVALPARLAYRLSVAIVKVRCGLALEPPGAVARLSLQPQQRRLALALVGG
jgi:hypothetical protein